MALPEHLTNLRKYLKAAFRELESLEAESEEWTLPLVEIRESLNRAIEWVEEYTVQIIEGEDNDSSEIDTPANSA